MSNVPPIQITPTGVVVPQAVDVRQGVLNDLNQAFGGDLDIVTPSTPQAYMADNTTANITTANAAVAYTLAMIDPATSEGRWQDAIGRIYFLPRIGARSSVVAATCTGQPFAVMPVNSLAEDDSGNLWASLGAATFDAGGQAVVQFACQVAGPIELGIGELTKIAQLSPGWDAITNLSPATVGSLQENRTEYEIRRQESVAKNGKGTPPSIRSAVWEVPGVLDVFVYDNFTNDVLPYGPTNYPLAPHSVYVGVVGGADQDIADAIFTKKDLGCDMNGNTTIVVYDTAGYDFPYPQYNITFNRPDPLPVKFAVQIANNASLPADIMQLTKDAIRATFNGQGNAARPRMGGAIFASSYYAGIAAIGPQVNVLQMKIGTTTPTLDQIMVGIDQTPTLTDADIAVTLV